ncbi:translocation/assembly module TamB domain-containing protein [Sphingomonas naphthae]|uniref:Translocation/assembly module TamB domain-containing protein n=1 Tax=Sphingomonas naphthae TaxID=1813468 RepID=A0ABY7TLI6_9SPHN|nr:translocation/assembly module TamB domain-containing protein [Sphingomonas naphthae]WCT74101.1 translocation/assembly module TamB domain-containing protein [Sphingomonas naphthae]
MARRVVKWIGIGLAAIVLILGLALLAVDTGPGHRLITDRIAALRIPSGLQIRIGRIDGSIWRRATLRDVRLYDTHGLFLEAPQIELDWRPWAWSDNRLQIERLTSDLVTVARVPALRSTGQPMTLPGFDIHIGRLAVKTLRLGPAIAGKPTVASIDGRADLRDRRALIDLAVSSRLGDRAQVHLDAAPDDDRFELTARIAAPQGGAIGAVGGLKRGLALAIDGKGGWTRWDGTARASLDGRRMADIALGVRDGRATMRGSLSAEAFAPGKLRRLASPGIRIAGDATFADRRLQGGIRFDTPELRLTAGGTLDFAEGAFRAFRIDAFLLQPRALFPNMTGRDIRLTTTLDGAFATAAFRYGLIAPRVAFDNTGFDGVRAEGAGQFSPSPVKVPIRLTARRVTGVGDVAGGILANLRVQGVLAVTAKTLTGDGLLFDSDKLKGKLGLSLDLVTGSYAVSVSGSIGHYLIPGLGLVDVKSDLKVSPGPGGRGTIVAGKGYAWVRRLDNAFFRSLAGGLPRLVTDLRRTPDGVMHFSNLVLTAPAIRIAGTGLRRVDGTFQFKGRGTQRQYGAFTLGLDGDIAKPKVDLLLDAPLDALGLAAVRATLDPIAEGFAYRAAGQSTLGAFTSDGRILMPPAAPTVIDIARLDVSGTTARGRLRSDPQGFTGELAVAGGGIDGTIAFAPAGGDQDTSQRITPRLAFQGATLAMDVPVRVRRGRVDLEVVTDPAGASIEGRVLGIGVRRGTLGIGRAALTLQLKNGIGKISGRIAGSRGRAFVLNGAADLGADSVTLTGGGTIDRQPIQLSEPARLTRDGDGWRLATTRMTFAGGSAALSGRFGGGPVELAGNLDRMPLSVLDVAVPNLGLGGYATGRFAYASPGVGATPTGSANLTIRGLTRSGLVMSSAPIDLGLVGKLDGAGLAGRAVAATGGKTVGRAQFRAAPLAGGATIADRLNAAPLFAQLRYNGPADILWRLTGVETIDLTGPVAIGADVGGTLANPLIRGIVRSNAARLESAVSGTVVQKATIAGRFDGARLILDRVAGETSGGGTVAGTGSFGFSSERGFTMDMKLDAKAAQLLNRDDIGATITGPLRLTLDPSGGTIAGDVTLDKSRFRLGRAVAAEIPRLKVNEINRPVSDMDEEAPPAPWKLDLKARARNRLAVTGLGLDSEWRADLTIGGTIDNPAIGGRADLMRGGYEFAGRRFDLDRGLIRFTGEAPPDPLLDIVAKANISGLSATIRVTGTGLKPLINFESVPALPEDELLSRLLFGTSITNLSAPEALQLAAAVASLRDSGGGGLGLDPINAIRRATGLDRLRILPADVTTGQGTSVAAGKYIGRRTYVELISDGAGYSATRVEFQITRWLSILSTVSTIGRQSANVRVSRDY